MPGILLGAALTLGVVAFVHRRRYRRCGYGPRGRRRGEGRGERVAMRYVFDRLDTTSEQEDVIRAEIKKLRGRARELGAERDLTRDDVAQLLRGDEFDEVRAGEMFARQDEALRELRKAALDAFTSIHMALDPEQRTQLADHVERWRRRPRFGPYRTQWV